MNKLVSLSALFTLGIFALGCGSDKKESSKLAATDVVIFPKDTDAGVLDLKTVPAGEYKLKRVRTYQVSTDIRAKALFELALKNPGVFSKQEDQFTVKSEWGKDPAED